MIFLFQRYLLSFDVMWRQIVPIDGPLMGRVWLHRPRAGPPRRAHLHDELEFNLVLAGRASYLVDQHRHDLRPGAMIWLFPDQSHVLLNESPTLSMWIVVFRPEMVQWHARTGQNLRLRDRTLGTDVCRYAAAAQLEQVNQLDAHLQQLTRLVQPDGQNHRTEPAQRGGGSQAISTEHPPQWDQHNALLGLVLLQAWHLFGKMTRSAEAASQIHPAVASAANRLRQHEVELDLPELASRCGISASRLSRLFKRQLGMSVTEYRNRARVDQYLQRRAIPGRPRRSIIEDALASGFGSYPQFHRIFRQYIGVSPRDFEHRQQ